MSLLDVLTKLNEELDDEEVDGQLVSKTADMVDLEIAAVFLCVEHRHDDYTHNVPTVRVYEKNGERWLIPKPEDHDFEWVTEDQLKMMRARFLLMNGWYYRNFHSLPHSMKCLVHDRFLSKTHGTPPSPDSPIGKLIAEQSQPKENA